MDNRDSIEESLRGIVHGGPRGDGDGGGYATGGGSAKTGAGHGDGYGDGRTEWHGYGRGYFCQIGDCRCDEGSVEFGYLGNSLQGRSMDSVSAGQPAHPKTTTETA